MPRTVSACRTPYQPLKILMDGPTLLRMTLTMTIDDCVAFAFLMTTALLSSVRFEGVVAIAEELGDAYELQSLCWQWRVYKPVESRMTSTIIKDSSEGPATSVLSIEFTLIRSSTKEEPIRG
ncbi:hypothetical protein D6D01_03926 [Aureobasidium pullulans]|uniref:Uncharacterized protein n=1 Tax=Aureobasidium pullulans TaxID=5580 RepID=A0A4S9LHE1_AURPU|nr:hypothetical protein D6D01_03926 [Aureobasidium pullulans]